MNSMIMSSRKALVAKPTQSRRVASKATRRPVAMAGMQVLKPEKRYGVPFLPPPSLRRRDLQADRLPRRQRMGSMHRVRRQEEADTNQLFFAGPALYENRYWTMWKLPMFGCQSGDEVLAEIQNCQDEYPGYRVRVVGFDNVRQCQMAGFICRK